MAAGLDAVLIGTVLHFVAEGESNRFVASGGTDASLRTEAQTLDTFGTVGWVAGGVLVVSGVMALVLGASGASASDRRSRVHAAVGIGPRGLAVRGTF